MDPKEKYFEMLSAMIDGELSDSDREELMAHVREDEQLRRVYEAFAAISGDLGELAPVPEGLCASVMGSITAKSKKKVIHWQRYAAMAACLVLVCVAGLRGMGGMPMGGAMQEAAFVSVAGASAPKAAPAAAMPENCAPAESAPESSEPMPMPESEAQAQEHTLYAEQAAGEADGAFADTMDVMTNSMNFSRLALNYAGNSYEATDDEAKYLLSNLVFDREAAAPESEPDATIDLSTGEVVELWNTAQGVVCRMEGLSFVPAGDAQTIAAIIEDITH